MRRHYWMGNVSRLTSDNQQDGNTDEPEIRKSPVELFKMMRLRYLEQQVTAELV